MRNIFRILCLLLLCNVAALAQTNTLTVPDVSVPKNGTISLPVQLDNTSDIVAVQFTLTMPEGFVLSEGQCALTERADGHAVRMKNMGNRRYMVMIMSGDNKYIKARTGSLLTVPLSPEYELMEGSEHQMALSDVVITSKDGKNVATGYSAGKITIATLPDFEVSAVAVSASDLVPGQQFDVNWTVKNIGHKESSAGWKEQIVLVDNDGNEKTLATVQNNDALNAGGVSSRSARITLPEQVGIDGEARIRVDLIPYSDAGEPAYLRENNTAFSGTTLNISKRLTLTPTTANVEEVNQQIRFYLARSGRTSQEENFPLVADADSRVSLPEEVVIPQEQPGVYFYAQITANQRLDNDSIVNFAVSGNGYDEVKAKLVIEDDTYPKLSITASAQEIQEGRSMTLTITTERASANGIPVKLVSDLPSRIFIPSDIVIPAGKTSVDVLVDAIEDDVPDVEQVVVFTASAEKHESATLHTTVIDNDVPTLQLTLSPSEVSEDAGPESVVATIRRLDNVNKKVTINFSDDSNGNIHYSQQTIEMASGVQEMKVNLGPIDNNIVDGNRTYNISAAVWIASCSCNAANGTSGGVVSAPLTVNDNESAALSVSASSSIMKEGEEITVTVSRNADFSKDVVVYVSSDHDSALEYPSTVTIPAGQNSVSFTVKAISNEVAGDDFNAVLTLQGNGFGKSTINISVSDQSMADAKVTGLTISASEAYAGDVVTANLSLANVGNSTLPAETKVAFYVDNSSTPVATTTLSSSLAAGESTTVSQEITVPFAIGNYNVYAKVNYDGAVAELSSSNNMSQYVPISILPPFTATVSVGKDAYNQGETINISGKVSGKDVANKTVEIYVINEGNRRAITVETDANGNFTADYTPIEGQIGSFSVGACYPSEGKDDELASFNVYGLKISAPWSEHSLAQNVEEKFTIEVTNPCSVPQNKIKVTAQAESDNCEFSFATISKLGAGESVTIECTAKPSQITSGRDFQKLPLTIASKEGASVEHILYYYVMPAYGKLESSVKEINTTMTLGTPRDYPLVVRNAGKGETGTITFALPSYITMATSKTVPSLASGDSTTVVLRINPTDKMQLNVPVTGRIGINCANGEGLAMSFSVTPVSAAKGKLKLSLVDEFTFYTAEAPRISGATVTVKKPGTKEVVAAGTSDANGSFEVELQEGYYALSVDAEHHDSYNNYILIDPDKTLEKEIFLSYQSVTYSWNVEETEIDDVYTFETKVDYDVRVPKPVVIISLPKEFPEPYDVFPIVVTNKGLISAVDLHLAASASNGYKLEFISNPRLDSIMPQQSEMFYVRYLPVDAQQNAKRRANGASDPCQKYTIDIAYDYICGKYTECVKVEEGKVRGYFDCLKPTVGAGTQINGLPQRFNSLSSGPVISIDEETYFCEVHGFKNCGKEIPVGEKGEAPILDYVLVNADQCVLRNGAAADGVSQLKIILDPETSKLPAGNFKVTWYPFDEKYGKLIFPDNNKRTLNNVVYQAPDNFPGGLNEPEVVLTVKFDVKCDNYENTFEIPITITRPPLLLMHGLNSDKDAWEEPMRDDFVARGMYHPYQIVCFDYHETNCDHFYVNYNKPAIGIKHLLKNYRDKNIEAKKVDYIGHSMGGILGRFYTQQQDSLGNVPAIHKFITINTPHSGSHFGDIVKNHSDMRDFNEAIGMFKKYEAIYDLATQSVAINKYLNKKQNWDMFKGLHGIPVHAISTNVGTYDEHLVYYMLKYGSAAVNIPTTIWDVFAAMFGSEDVDDVDDVDRMDFAVKELEQMGNSDLIVPLTSQLGGINLQQAVIEEVDDPSLFQVYSELHRNGYSIFSYDIHYYIEQMAVQTWYNVFNAYNHMGSPKLDKVIDKIVTLLNARTDSEIFGHKWFSPRKEEYTKVTWGKSNSPVAKSMVKQSVKQKSKSSKFLAANVEGDSLQITVNENLKSCRLFVKTEKGTSVLVTKDAKIYIPSTFSGKIDVIAMAKDEEGNDLIDEASVTIATPRATPTEISAIAFDVDSEEKYSVSLAAKWDDGSETRIVPETAVFKNGIAKYENGMIVPIAGGEDEITFSYKGLTCKAPLTVHKEPTGDDGEGICSTITLSFKQTAYVTRQAFRGTLKLNNGYQEEDLKDFKLNLTVTDENGNVAGSDKFQINPESLEGFEGDLELGAGWNLRAGKDGVATIIFIPTKNAAPTAPKQYNFGGSFSYIEPSNGLLVTRTMSPVTLTVNPSPSLDFTFFMQRDVLGDDPMTETVEPSKEAEFSLLINNKGYGDAKRVQFATKQPEIVDNEKNLVIDFEILSSQFNGEDKNLALGGDVVTDFGTIPANSTAYAQWWMKSSLLGHFTDYNVEATHVTSYDNPDLSLLNEVNIHELIRSLEIQNGDQKMVGFLANDIKDDNHVPDMLYLSNGETKDVVSATGTNIVKNSSTEYTLTVAPSAAGWNYGNLLDPTYGAAELTGVVRQSDGKVIPLRNFWQTDRTLRDNKDPLYENRIHFADEFKTPSAETYILTFTPLPDLLLEVMAFENIPDESSYVEEPLETVKVIFNKTIDPATFTTDDLSMIYQGKKQDVSLIGISTTDNKTFTLDLTEINKLCGNGFYNLTVQTAEITDDEGYNGREGKNACWVMQNPMLNEGTLLYNGNSIAIPVALSLPNKPAEATAVNAMVFTKADLSTQADVFANLAYKKMTDEGSIWTSKNIELVDAQPFFTPYDVEADKVTYTREFKNTNWQALYVPFPVDVFEFAGKADVAYFTNVYMHDSDNDGVGDMAYLQLKNMESGKLEPNEPYLIKPYAVGKMVIETQNTTLSSTVQNGRIEFAIPTDIYTLTGTYQPTVMYETGHYGLSGGEFKYALSPEAVLSPFRFYLDITSLTGKPTPLMCGIIFDDETTGIRNANDNSNAELYDLQGRRVKNPTAAGVYVTKGGKRVKK